MACLTPAPLVFLLVLSTSWPSLISSTSCGLFFWIRILNQINSGIGRNAVCRERIHTPHPFLACCWNWGRGGRKAHPPSLLSSLSPTCPLCLPVGPSLSASPLCCSLPTHSCPSEPNPGGHPVPERWVWNPLPQRKRPLLSPLLLQKSGLSPWKGLKLQGDGRRRTGKVEGDEEGI